MFDKLKSIKKGYVKYRDKPDQSLPYAKVQKRGKWIRRFVKPSGLTLFDKETIPTGMAIYAPT